MHADVLRQSGIHAILNDAQWFWKGLLATCVFIHMSYLLTLGLFVYFCFVLSFPTYYYFAIHMFTQ